ncbi:rhamnulokinase family protein [Lysinibacter sp. HNR]|uniref:rhamnulokinase n=1 Tax=Lysinibacter sp. HNR TaxID=3031408 RepID=UPI002434F424|nr:rhamnulokinase family protein [Lysinibacter sp. HNR]WGD37670.1 rhamnulokinase [Lysinibacter sp. HNR]
MSEKNVVAVDLGATSGRVIVGRVTPRSIRLTQTARFANNPVTVWEGANLGMHWNILELYRSVGEGLREAFRGRKIESIGVDSWAVDYGRLRNGVLRGIPYHYRDPRTTAGVAATHSIRSHAELYAVNGLQFLPFNTLYQLSADRIAGNLSSADSILLIPDLINYWLTGVRRTEVTNASTTGLLDIATRQWSDDLFNVFDVPRLLLPQLISPGQRVGTLLEPVAHTLNAPSQTPVVSVGSHDTASAIVAVPSVDRDIAYISSGTWSLVGFELDAPVLTEASRRANFTNEAGVDGRVRYLRNVMGMWLISECLREWEAAGHPEDLVSLLGEATELSHGSIFDVNHDDLLPEGPMTSRIARLCAEADQPVPQTPAEFVRTIMQSLAETYSHYIRLGAELSSSKVNTIHIVGGGSQNALLCQLTADRTGVPVIAGPVEATALGNVLVQARTADVIWGDLESLRALVISSTSQIRYTPRTASRG